MKDPVFMLFMNIDVIIRGGRLLQADAVLRTLLR